MPNGLPAACRAIFSVVHWAERYSPVWTPKAVKKKPPGQRPGGLKFRLFHPLNVCQLQADTEIVIEQMYFLNLLPGAY